MGITFNNEKAKKEIYDLIKHMGIDDRHLLFVGDGYIQNTFVDFTYNPSVMLNTTKVRNALPNCSLNMGVPVAGSLKDGHIDVISIGKPCFRTSGENSINKIARTLKVPSINIKRLIDLSQMEDGKQKIIRLLGEEPDFDYDTYLELLKDARKTIVPGLFSGIIQINPNESDLKELAKAYKYKLTRCPVYLGYHTDFSNYGLLEKKDLIIPPVEAIREIFHTDNVKGGTQRGARVLKIS